MNTEEDEFKRIEAEAKRRVQEPVAWKLVPIEPTDEMLKAMDECSTEGYDERLLAGHAASVYMAAVDVAPTPPAAQQEPTPWRDMVVVSLVREGINKHKARELADHFAAQPGPREYWNAVEGWVKIDEVREHFDSINCGTIYSSAGEDRVPLYTAPAQRKPLTDKQILADETLRYYFGQNGGAGQEVLRVTPDGQFIWHEDADRMIEEGDFSFSPAMPHILKALRKQRTWVGLTPTQVKLLWEGVPEEAIKSGDSVNWIFYTHINEALKERNT